MRGRARFIVSVLLAAHAAALLSCAGSPSRDDRARPDPLPRAPSGARGESLRIERPVATPVDPADSASASIAVAVKPCGQLPFNGQLLPLVSPDGRFVVTQTGAAPPWVTILGGHGAIPPTDLRLAVHALRDDRLTSVDLDLASHGPLLLGRSCNRRGFIVESIRPGGERWIGFVEWLSGQLTWLTSDAMVNAQATLLDLDGTDIAWIRRRFESSRWELVIRRDGREQTLPAAGSSWQAPFMSDAPQTLCAFELRADGEMHLVAIDLTLPTPGAVARAVVGRTSDELLAWQATAAVQTPPADVGAIITDGRRRGRALFHHPLRGHMAIFDIPSGAIINLEPHSIAGAWNPAPASDGQLRGVFLTTPEGLAHQAVVWTPPDGAPTTTRAVHILGDAHVARLIDPVERTYLLIGPDAAQPMRRLQLTLMQAAPTEGWFRVTR